MSSFANYGGQQFNAPGGTQNIGVQPKELAARIAETNAPLLAQLTAAGIKEGRIVELASRISAEVVDFETALAELRRAVEVAIEVHQRGHAGSNTGDFAVLARMAELSDQGRDDEAAAEADRAFAAWQERQTLEAKKGIELLNAGLRADILRRDAASAARRIAQRAEIKTPDPAARFEALRSEQAVWYEGGRDKGLALDLRVAIDLVRIALGPRHNTRSAWHPRPRAARLGHGPRQSGRRARDLGRTPIRLRDGDARRGSDPRG